MTIWNTENVQELIQEPQILLKDRIWRDWIASHGGLSSVYKELRNLPLSQNQKNLLETILEYPGRSAYIYADMLHVHYTTYYRHLKRLTETICHFLNTAESTPSSEIISQLPHPITTLVGRESLINTCIEMLETTRLINLAGIGGIGKTRLALAIGQKMQQTMQVVWVNVSNLQSADLFFSTLAQVLDIQERTTDSLQKLIIKTLRQITYPLLIIIDNLEYALEDSTFLLDVLESSGRLKILVTSRTVLRVIGESVLVVPPLSVDIARNTPTQIGKAGAVEVFIQRAQAVQPDWHPSDEDLEHITNICIELDGIPLSIEMTAPWIRLLEPVDILHRLRQRFDLLEKGTQAFPERDQALESIVELNYQILPESVQRIFIQLSMFAGNWRLEQAFSVVGDSYNTNYTEFIQCMMQLQDACLIQRDVTSQRWSMLQTLREYALPHLYTNPELSECYLRWMHWFNTELDNLPSFSSSEHERWYDFIAQEYVNCRSILFWAYTYAPVLAVELSASLWRFWWLSGRISEGRQLLLRALESSAAVPFALHVRALNGLGALSWSLGAWEDTSRYFEQCLNLQLAHNDEDGAAITLNNIGLLAIRQKRYSKALQIFENNLEYFHKTNNMYAYAASVSNLGVIKMYQGEYAQAEHLFNESLILRKSEGNPWSIAASLTNLGRVLVLQGAIEYAWQAYLESLNLLYDIGEREIQAESLEGVAHCLLLRNHHERAIQCLALAQNLRESIGSRLYEPELSLYETIYEQLKYAVDPHSFIVAQAVGYSMPFTQMVSLLKKLSLF